MMTDPSKPGGQSTGIHEKSSSSSRSDNASQRPFARLHNGSPFRSHASNTFGRPHQAEWTTWQELSIRISDLPASTTTRDLWRYFSAQGTIIGIELYENQRGQRDGRASVRFRYAYLQLLLTHLLTIRKARHQTMRSGGMSDTRYQLLLRAPQVSA